MIRGLSVATGEQCHNVFVSVVIGWVISFGLAVALRIFQRRGDRNAIAGIDTFSVPGYEKGFSIFGYALAAFPAATPFPFRVGVTAIKVLPWVFPSLDLRRFDFS